MAEAPTSTPRAQPAARWPWQRSLRLRILLSFGAVVLLVLALATILVSRAVYRAVVQEAERALELEAVLAANALEDPLSGYVAELESYQDRDAEHDDDDIAKDDEKTREEKNEREDGSDKTSEEEVNGQGARDTEEAIGLPTPSPSTAAPGIRPLAGRLQEAAQRFAAANGARVVILDPDGDVLADSAASFSSGMAHQGRQPEVRAALDGLVQKDVRRAAPDQKLALFVAAPIQQGEHILGLVQMARPMNQITAGFRRFLLQLAGISLLALALATLLGVAISRRLLRPVQQLQQASVRVADGDLSQQTPVETADELGALATAFNHMVQAVREMVAQQRLFVANASHELRTPLTNIKLRSEALLGGADQDPAVARRYLSEIDREADRLARLASALLDLSRLEEGRVIPAPAEAVDLLPLLHGVADATALQIAQAGLTFCVELPPTLPRVAVWPEQIEAVLVNLLDNAIKFTPAGGQISLSAETTDKACLIRVADTGPGIPAADQPHIFERFYRADKARSRVDDQSGSSGAGLGLSIAKALVEQNGGRITVASQPSAGAVFTVELPR